MKANTTGFRTPVQSKCCSSWYWTWKIRHGRPGRPKVPRETRELIRTMSRENVIWGVPRIRSELLKLGIRISEASVAKYMVRHHKPPSQTWRTFLHLRRRVSETGRGVGYQRSSQRSEVSMATRLHRANHRIDKTECLDHVIIFDEASLRRTLRYVCISATTIVLHIALPYYVFEKSKSACLDVGVVRLRRC